MKHCDWFCDELCARMRKNGLLIKIYKLIGMNEKPKIKMADMSNGYIFHTTDIHESIRLALDQNVAYEMLITI